MIIRAVLKNKKGNRTATRLKPLRLLSSEPDRIGGQNVRAGFRSLFRDIFVLSASRTLSCFEK